uniref:Uncharacterized protein n=1 Tax=Kryptoperidinium triquetrum TaxID=66468 RepID=Q5ENJ6_KRYTR|nr:unknown protein [Heterocapsa triquetra]
MARSSVPALLIACALVAMMGSFALSFVGTQGVSLRGTSVRTPEVAMQFFGGEPATTTPPPPPEATADGTFVIGLTAFFFVSVLANVNGFFNP